MVEPASGDELEPGPARDITTAATESTLKASGRNRRRPRWVLPGSRRPPVRPQERINRPGRPSATVGREAFYKVLIAVVAH